MTKYSNKYKDFIKAIKNFISGKYDSELKTHLIDKNCDEIFDLMKKLGQKIEKEYNCFKHNRVDFEEFADVLPLIIFETDDKGNLIYVNKIAHKIFGYTKKDLKNGLNALMMIAPDDRNKAAENMIKRITGEMLTSQEYTAITKKGKEFPVLLHSIAVKKNDTFFGFRGFLIDISELKQVQLELKNSKEEMEENIKERTSELQTAVVLLENKIKEHEKSVEALKQSEERYKSLFERSFNGIYIHDFLGNFLDANDVALDMVGYNRDDINKLNFASLITKDQYPKTLEDLKELKETGSQKKVSTYKLRKKDGTFVWIETKSSVIYRNNEPYAIQGIARDITDRMKTEKELSENKKYVENILMSMVDSLFVIDEEAKIKTVNFSTLDLLGFELDKLLGQHVKIILEKDYYDKNNDDVFQGFFKNLIIKGFVRNHEMYFKHNDGEIIPVNVSGSVMKDDSNEMIGIVCIAHDMRDIRNATAQLVQSEKLAALGQLVAGLAHELNQPLNNIMIISQSLTRDVQKGRLSEEELENDLDEIIQHVNKMSSIITHTRDFSRDSDKENRDLLNLNEIVENSLKFVNAQLKVHNFDVKLDLQENLSEVVLNPIQIEQVLLNFVTNAKFSIEKSEKEKREISIKTFQKDDKVAVEISDNGIGIPDNILNKIFQPFFTTKPKGEGTGLGLSVAQSIIESHNGKIEVDNKPEEGATFRILFPVAQK